MASINQSTTVTFTDTAFASNARRLTFEKTTTWTDGEVLAEWFQDIGTTHEQLDTNFAALGQAGGKLIIQNLDDTNFVEIGRDVSSTFYDVARINPQDILPSTLSTNFGSMYLKADTAACKVRVIITKA